jgi:hypothetical protein
LKKAEEQRSREGWQLATLSDASSAHPLLHETEQRRGFRSGISKQRFVVATTDLIARDAATIYGIVDRSGHPVAAGLAVRDRHFAYYLASGAAPGRPKPFLGNYLLLSAMIEDAVGRGLGFDFEGSMLPGVEPFFRGWGGEIRHNLRQMRFSSSVLTALWTFATEVRRRRSRRSRGS